MPKKGDGKLAGLKTVPLPRIAGVRPYFEEDGFVLYHGDSLEMLTKLPEESVDMIFADPPYHLSSDGFTCQAGRRVSVNKGEWDRPRGVEEDFEFHLEWIRKCRHPLKKNGTIWISGTMHSVFKCGYALQLAGYKLLNDIAWFKPNAPPHLACRYFAHSHETLLWARKFKDAHHTFHYELMKTGVWNGDFLKRPNRQMRSVWAVNTPPAEEKVHGKHPTQKPLALLLRIVLACTSRGDLVLDPFSGSSTTGLACWLTGRRFIGIDTEERFLELSLKRFHDVRDLKGSVVVSKPGVKRNVSFEAKGAQDFKTRSTTIEDFLRELDQIVRSSR